MSDDKRNHTPGHFHPSEERLDEMVSGMRAAFMCDGVVKGEFIEVDIPHGHRDCKCRLCIDE